MDRFSPPYAFNASNGPEDQVFAASTTQGDCHVDYSFISDAHEEALGGMTTKSERVHLKANSGQDEMFTVARIKRLTHGFSILTIVQHNEGAASLNSPPLYAIYQGVAFCYASSSIERALEKLHEVGHAFVGAFHIGHEEKAHLASHVTQDEITSCQLQKNYEIYQHSVTRHEHEIDNALARDRDKSLEAENVALLRAQ